LHREAHRQRQELYAATHGQTRSEGAVKARLTQPRRSRRSRWSEPMWTLSCRAASNMAANCETVSQTAPQHRNPRKFGRTVFDVGMHDGADTAFYLHQGCAVLAIEADPALAAAGRRRFR